MNEWVDELNELKCLLSTYYMKALSHVMSTLLENKTMTFPFCNFRLVENIGNKMNSELQIVISTTNEQDWILW